MKYSAFGLLLFTENYEACVSFYRETLELETIFEEEFLTNFRFGSGYLMVERGGAGAQSAKDFAHNPTVIRFDVEDVDQAADELRAKGVVVTREDFEWGWIAVFYDPDGNRCELYQTPPGGKGNL